MMIRFYHRTTAFTNTGISSRRGSIHSSSRVKNCDCRQCYHCCSSSSMMQSKTLLSSSSLQIRHHRISTSTLTSNQTTNRKNNNVNYRKCTNPRINYATASSSRRRKSSNSLIQQLLPLVVTQQQQLLRFYSNTMFVATTAPNNPITKNKTIYPRSNIIKVAIVGSGPSGCYTAKYLSKALLQLQQQQQQAKDTTSTNGDRTNNDTTTITSTTTTQLQPLPEQSSRRSPFIFQIDMIEQLPTPYGLVRYGVAPDHPEVKNVQSDFDALFTTTLSTTSMDGSSSGSSNTTQNHSSSSSSSSGSSINFLGNVTVGMNVTIHELRQLYTIVILCYGCDSDCKLNVPIASISSPSSLPSSNNNNNNNIDTATSTNGIGGYRHEHNTGSYHHNSIISAREFVAWYNGHPHYDHIGSQLVEILKKKKTPSSNTTTPTTNDVVIVGHGNVALDCARIIAKGGSALSKTYSDDNDSTTPTRGGLYDTDITTRAWNVLQEYPISTISIVGRRGHVQASFTIKEVRELVNLQSAEEGNHDTSFIVRTDELDMCTATSATQQELNGPNGRPKIRIDKLLRDAAASSNTTDDTSTNRRVRLRFLLNPVRIETNAVDPTSLVGVVCERNMLTGDAGRQQGTGTGELETITASLVLVSIGYKGIPLPGTEAWFDEDRGTLRNDRGRVDTSASSQLGGLYTSGWIKRGPQGIIGTNIADARETVGTIMTDLENTLKLDVSSGGSTDGDDGAMDLHELLKQRGVQVVDWNGYRRIEAKEHSIRRSEHQPREKIVKLEDQLAAAFSV